MPTNYYHTGIKRDEKNKNIWKRSSDGVQVNVNGWDSYNGFPVSYNTYDFLYLRLYNDPSENTIQNWPDIPEYFICEY